MEPQVHINVANYNELIEVNFISKTVKKELRNEMFAILCFSRQTYSRKIRKVKKKVKFHYKNLQNLFVYIFELKINIKIHYDGLILIIRY